MGWDGWIIPLRLLRLLEHVRLAVLIIEESIMTDENPSTFIRQISLRNPDPLKVDAQLSRLSSVFDSCCLCSIVIFWSKDSQCRNYGGKEDVVFVVAMN